MDTDRRDSPRRDEQAGDDEQGGARIALRCHGYRV